MTNDDSKSLADAVRDALAAAKPAWFGDSFHIPAVRIGALRLALARHDLDQVRVVVGPKKKRGKDA